MKSNMLLAILLPLFLVTAGYAQTLDKAKLDQLFDRLLENNEGMGSLTLAKDGNVLYSRSFGYSQINGTEKKLLTAETKYRIASITKTYTAVMIFQLVEEKKLRLTDTLDRFFPQIPNAARITIEHILAHRSGIHNLEADDSWAKQHRTQAEVVARIAQGQPDFEPDAQHKYSNRLCAVGLHCRKGGWHVSGSPYSARTDWAGIAKDGFAYSATNTAAKARADSNRWVRLQTGVVWCWRNSAG
ncbi:MAG: serine hydrolase domain-containing protein [Bryobacteraceae bacterium]